MYDLYIAYVSTHPMAVDAEISRILHHGCFDIVRGSKSSFVPKNVDISRQIATEPALNMFFQLGFGSLLETRLARRWGISFADQPDKNRMMARRGSISFDRDDSFATIDLRSASDLIALKHVAWALPPEWVDAILTLRSPATKVDDEWVDLKMCSTMGNGFTFPLQSIIFSCVVAAVYRLEGINLSTSWSDPTFGVFGDDIVIYRRCYSKVVRLLTLLGFDVNGDKSFSDGAFRESCGHDYYYGFNIRPVFVRRLDSVQDLYVLVNLLCDWSSRTGIMLPNLCRYIIESIPRNLRYPVPLGENLDAGLRVPRSFVLPKTDHNNSYVYRAMRPRIKRYRVGEDLTIFSPRKYPALMSNPAGLLMAFLKGEIRNWTLASRQRGSMVPLASELRVWPSDWQYIPQLPVQVFDSHLGPDPERLVTATLRNFTFIGESLGVPRALRKGA